MLKRAIHEGRTSNPTAHFGAAEITDLTRDGFMFAGGPEAVFEQLCQFHERVGGFGNLLMMIQGGTMGFDLAAHSMSVFASAVLPRLRKEWGGDENFDRRRSTLGENGDRGRGGRSPAPSSALKAPA